MYKKNPKGWLKHWEFLLLDMICLEISFVLGYYFRHGHFNFYETAIYRNTSMTILFINLAVCYMMSAFENVLKRGYLLEFKKTLHHVMEVMVTLILYLFLVQAPGGFSRMTFLYTGILYLLASYVSRVCFKRYACKRMDVRKERSMLLITTSGLAQETLEKLKDYNHHRIIFSGVVLSDGNNGQETICGVPVVCDFEHVVEYACREWVDEALIVMPEDVLYPKELLQDFYRMGITTHFKVAGLGEENQYIEIINGITVLTSSIKYVTTKQLFMKRVLDICGGLVGSLIALILAAIIGPMIRKESPGPIFFSQVRVGKNGKKFKIYKFRSMYLDAEERKAELMKENRVSDGMMFKLDYDPRIIGSKKLPDGTIKKGIGNIIRDYSLDEFPQFFNVLKGDMSLVGTRPPTVDEWEKYDLHHRTRLAIKPGITGMWQTSGRSNITDFEEVVKLDNEYIQNFSISTDIRLLFKTVLSVLKKDGSM